MRPTEGAHRAAEEVVGGAETASAGTFVSCHAAKHGPCPADRGPGRITFLSGASSSGKSTLAEGMQLALAEPFLHVCPAAPCDWALLHFRASGLGFGLGEVEPVPRGCGVDRAPDPLPLML